MLCGKLCMMIAFIVPSVNGWKFGRAFPAGNFDSAFIPLKCQFPHHHADLTITNYKGTCVWLTCSLHHHDCFSEGLSFHFKGNMCKQEWERLRKSECGYIFCFLHAFWLQSFHSEHEDWHVGVSNLHLEAFHRWERGCNEMQ